MVKEIVYDKSPAVVMMLAINKYDTDMKTTHDCYLFPQII